jgi:pentatricopeptide repeat protein
MQPSLWHQTGGIAVNNIYQFDSSLRSSSAGSDASNHSPESTLYHPQYIFYPSGGFYNTTGASKQNALVVKTMTSTNCIVEKPASAVEELKALILACDAGTGEVARHIEAATFTPRVQAFTSLLQLASKSRQPEKAVEIFEAMQSIGGISPNTFSYSALISALGRVGNWQLAERYFNELIERSKTDPELRPNTVTYAALISGK